MRDGGNLRLLLSVYVDSVQVGAFGYPPIEIGREIDLTLVGNPGSTMGVEVPSLCSFVADKGKKALIRIGLAEYAFSGLILEVRYQTRSGFTYREALVDCGFPLVFVTHGIPGIHPLDLDDPTKGEVSRGRYLSGLMFLSGQISFRSSDPPLIKAELKSRVKAISVIDLRPDSMTLGGLKEVESLDSATASLPALLGVEV